MPIAAELRAALYNSAPWLELSRRLRDERAGGRCECIGQCGRHHGVVDVETGEVVAAGVGHRCPHIDTMPACEQRGIVRLGVAHWHQSESGLMVPEDRLIVMCQGCHLRWDMESHLAARHANRMSKLVKRYGQQDLFRGEVSTQIH